MSPYLTSWAADDIFDFALQNYTKKMTYTNVHIIFIVFYSVYSLFT